MGFFFSQESLTVWQWALRGITAYLFLLLAAKLMGQRAIAELRFLDFVTALILGNILAHPLSDERLGLLGSMVTTLVIALFHLAGILLGLKSRWLRRFLEPTPVILIRDGQIRARGIARARLSLETLLSELRMNKVADLEKVALALWEPGGRLSVFLHPKNEPATPSDLKVATAAFALPKVVVREGRVDRQALTDLGKDEAWLKRAVADANLDLQGILLATLAENGHLHLVPYRLD